MVKALVSAALAWPILLGAAVVARAHDEAPGVVTMVYLATSRICHQKPERSFHSDGVKWPVCGRCSGLYAGGALGALAWVALRRRATRARLLASLAVAAVPTALMALFEWTGTVGIGNLARAVAGIPLGAMIAVVILHTADHGTS